MIINLPFPLLGRGWQFLFGFGVGPSLSWVGVGPSGRGWPGPNQYVKEDKAYNCNNYDKYFGFSDNIYNFLFFVCRFFIFSHNAVISQRSRHKL